MYKNKLNLMPQDEFDRKIDFQRQKIAARKLMRQNLLDDYNAEGIRWNTLKPIDEARPIKVISRNNLCVSKSCIPKQGAVREKKQCRFGDEPEVVVRHIPKGDEEYLFSEDEEEPPPPKTGKQIRFGDEPQVTVTYIPRGYDQYIFSEDEEEVEEEEEPKPITRADIMSQELFDRKIDFQRQKIAAKKKMKRLLDEDEKEAGFRWDTLRPDDTDAKINVISKDNPCTSKSCILRRDGAPREPKQFRFNETYYVHDIPKGDDEYLFSEDEYDEEEEQVEEDVEDEYDEEDEEYEEDEVYDDEEEYEEYIDEEDEYTTDESNDEDDDGQTYNVPNYEVKIAPTMAPDDQVDNTPTYVNTYAFMGPLKITKTPAGLNLQSVRGAQNG